MSVSPRGFTPKELKLNYYALSKIYHPDKNPDPSAVPKFIQIKLAYDVLGDSQKRLAYDLHFQTEFKEEERMLDQLKAQFNDETERQN